MTYTLKRYLLILEQKGERAQGNTDKPVTAIGRETCAGYKYHALNGLPFRTHSHSGSLLSPSGASSKRTEHLCWPVLSHVRCSGSSSIGNNTDDDSRSLSICPADMNSSLLGLEEGQKAIVSSHYFFV